MREFEVFNDKKILITGGTGSFGGALVERILGKTNVKIRVLSRDEKKQDDMRKKYASDQLEFFIGDVRDVSSLANCFDGVDYVFHAAALKQVPSCEFYPMEAVKTNIYGTGNVLDLAISNGVQKVVCLSTDKAVYPVNAMGMSKALMEKVALSKARSSTGKQTSICVTRYGNVMASRGSVIPLFADLVRRGEPLTVTDLRMTRFMMTLNEAVDLVLHAFNNGVNGEILVQKSPSVTLDVLAKAIVEYFGKKDHEIKVIGTRHGEKLHEVLLSREEMVRSLDDGRFYRVQPDTRTLNYDIFYSEGDEDISKSLEYSSENTTVLNKSEMLDLLKRIDF
ncbi:polysaccharide biosynthesis protein [Rhodobacterales bacterium FZCC0188]|nr:polysaccharide biosynthesis protein [Rhodobacterales bacterium FZCC0188]